MITVELPLQIVALLAAKVGVAFTVTVLEILEVHVPFAPIIVYTVVVGGLNVCVAPTSAPGFHVKDAAPLAVSTVELPLQIVPLLAAKVGVVFTFTVALILEVQVPLEPIIV